MELINNQQHYNMPDSQSDLKQDAATGGAEVIRRSESCISLGPEQRQGRLLEQLHGGSLGFPIRL